MPSFPLQVFLELQAVSQSSDRAFVLNPIVGPEPITGVEALTYIVRVNIYLTTFQAPLV